MSSESDPSENKDSIWIEKLNLTNWVQWKSRFTLYLKSHQLFCLFEDDWVKDDKNAKQFKKKNYKALNALYGAVSKDLHNKILENDTSFKDAWDTLASACGQNLVITICAEYRKVNQMKYQPGTSLSTVLSLFPIRENVCVCYRIWDGYVLSTHCVALNQILFLMQAHPPVTSYYRL
jgi:hypothetical protein